MENTQDLDQSIVLPERLLTAAEVAYQLHVSKSFAYLLMQSREIPTVHLGRACRVRPGDLITYIMRNIENKQSR
jgi:excisionase family DNA binding protein